MHICNQRDKIVCYEVTSHSFLSPALSLLVFYSSICFSDFWALLWVLVNFFPCLYQLLLFADKPKVFLVIHFFPIGLGGITHKSTRIVPVHSLEVRTSSCCEWCTFLFQPVSPVPFVSCIANPLKRFSLALPMSVCISLVSTSRVNCWLDGNTRNKFQKIFFSRLVVLFALFLESSFPIAKCNIPCNKCIDLYLKSSCWWA